MTNNPALAFNTAGIISLVVGFVLPNVVGYFTNCSLNKGMKAAILAGLAAASSFLTQWGDAATNGRPFVWQAAVLNAVATWLVAEGAYLRIWKPSGVSDYLQSVGVKDAAGDTSGQRHPLPYPLHTITEPKTPHTPSSTRHR